LAKRLGIVALVVVGAILFPPTRYLIADAVMLFTYPEGFYDNTGIRPPWLSQCDVDWHACPTRKPVASASPSAAPARSPSPWSPSPKPGASGAPIETAAPVETTAPATPEPTEGPVSPSLQYTTWTSAGGYISTKVPEGWTVDGGLGSDTAMGMFKVRATSPDGSMTVQFAHNWTNYAEAKKGKYQPGAATITKFILPLYLKEAGAGTWRVTWRSANTHVSLPGVPLDHPLDTGSIGFVYQKVADGSYHLASMAGQTLGIYPSTNNTGLWSMRVIALSDAPADAQSQADVADAITKLVDNLELSGEFFQVWNEGFAQTQRLVAAYSEQMRQIWESGYSSTLASEARVEAAWDELLTGGTYMSEEGTGTLVWVPTPSTYTWMNDQGQIVSNNTGTPPANGSNWHALTKTTWK
jgi:hypothetical protein